MILQVPKMTSRGQTPSPGGHSQAELSTWNHTAHIVSRRSKVDTGGCVTTWVVSRKHTLQMSCLCGLCSYGLLNPCRRCRQVDCARTAQELPGCSLVQCELTSNILLEKAV